MIQRKKYFLNFLAVSFPILVLSGFQTSDRLFSDLRAKEAFIRLNFFADGRGMHLMPGLIEVFERYGQNPTGLNFRDKLLHDHWGFNLQNHWPIGLFDEEYKGMHIGVLGCVACHSGKAAGLYIVGLGNKNLDVLRIGKDASLIERLYQEIRPKKDPSPEYIAVRNSAIEFAQLLSNQKIGNTTQGMVPVSFIRSWFYKQAAMNLPDDMTGGAVKIPSLWGYGEKRKVGQFSDGYGDGTFPGWAIAVELTGGQTAETVRSYLPKIEDAENLFSDLLPPPYPFSIEKNKAAFGKLVFEKTCAGCHGKYETDNAGLPIYGAPKFILLSKVGTDADRLAANTPLFDRLVETNPLHEVIKHTNLGQGYFAPRLVGIWSRFPYLHNGAIPNVKSLLTLPDKRPKVFSVKDAGEAYRFDQKSLGLTLSKELVQQTADFDGDALDFFKRTTYRTSEIGHSNQGHPFGTQLTPTEKQQLIEYLKTL